MLWPNLEEVLLDSSLPDFHASVDQCMKCSISIPFRPKIFLMPNLVPCVMEGKRTFKPTRNMRAFGSYLALLWSTCSSRIINEKRRSHPTNLTHRYVPWTVTYSNYGTVYDCPFSASFGSSDIQRTLRMVWFIQYINSKVRSTCHILKPKKEACAYSNQRIVNMFPKCCPWRNVSQKT